MNNEECVAGCGRLVLEIKKIMGGWRLASKIGGRWEVRLVGGGISKLVGGRFAAKTDGRWEVETLDTPINNLVPDSCTRGPSHSLRKLNVL